MNLVKNEPASKTRKATKGVRHLTLLLATIFGCLSARGTELVPAIPNDREVERRVEAMLREMTLDEKIGQLTQAGANIPGPNKESTEELVRQGKAGSVLWTLDSEFIQRLQTVAMTQTRMKIPLLFGFDVMHGYKNVFPVPIAMAATWDPALVERMKTIEAHEASASGINWNFSPMVDIARDARWGRMVEGAGEDTYLGKVMARAQVLGIQGPRLGTPNRMLACVKHFAAYGAAEGGRDYDTCHVSDNLLYNVYLPPFKAAIDAGAGSVMAAYMGLNDVPATGNEWLMKDILRKELGFTGLTISDSWSIASLKAHGFARDGEDAALKALKAGVAVDMGCMTYLKHAKGLVNTGSIPLADVDRMVADVLATKLKMGLFENPYIDLAKKSEVLGNPAHRDATRVAAQRSMVLLRNDRNTLPLNPHLSSIALIGPLANSTEDIKGSWTAEGGAAISVLEALQARLPKTRIEHVAGGDMQRAYAMPWDARDGKPAPLKMSQNDMKQELEKAVVTAKNAESVIMVLGERANMSGEAASSDSLALEGNQLELLKAVVATGKPVTLVLINGRPLDISWAADKVPAILEAWFPGSEGGNAIVDVLLGDVNPGGKLPVSWPRSAGQCPTYYNHNHTQAREDEPAFTSRYSNQSSTPLFPFGHGLSYTTFAYSMLKLDRTSMTADEKLQISVVVENTGKVTGDEVVQLYIHQRAGSSARPVRELKGFQRVTLAPGEQKTLSFTLGRAELEYWSPKTRSWVVEPETFDLWVGGDSKATTQAEFRIIY